MPLRTVMIFFFITSSYEKKVIMPLRTVMLVYYILIYKEGNNAIMYCDGANIIKHMDLQLYASLVNS